MGFLPPWCPQTASASPQPLCTAPPTSPSQSTPLAARARTWLSPWAFGSQSLAPEETEVCRQDEQPRPRCADTQSPVCSEKDSIQTRAGSQPAIQRSSPWQTRAGGSTAWHRPGKGWRSQAPPVPFRCSQTPLQPPGVMPSVLLCYQEVGLSQPISEPHRVSHSISTTQLHQHGAGN